MECRLLVLICPLGMQTSKDTFHDTQELIKSILRSSINQISLSTPPHLQGGVEDEVTLSAYITIALLEIPLPATVSTTSFPC